MSVVPKELLNKEFLSQFKTEEDESNFLKELHSQVLEQMLEGEVDYPWDTRKNLPRATIVETPAMELFQRLFKLNTEKP